MPDPTAPSASTASTEASAAAPSVSTAATSAPAPPERSAGQSWIDRLLGRGPAETVTSEDGSAPATTDETQTQEPTTTAADADTSPPEPLAKTYTPDELQRLVQAEVDRREAKRAKDQAEAERRRLRDNDPFEYAERDRKAEEAANATNAYGEQIARVAQSMDRALLDPMLERLPEKDRAALFELPDAGVGIDGRKALASAALDGLEKHWKAEGERSAEKKLRDNPAFRKQVLAELRDSPEMEEPEQINGTTRAPRQNGTSGADVSALLRQSLGYQ